MTTYFRPKTRGELRQKLKEKIKCEVPSNNEEITSLLLKSLDILNNESVEFTTYLSPNSGWIIYEAL